MLVGGLLAYCTSFMVYVFGTLKASRKIHFRLVESVLSATLRFVFLVDFSRLARWAHTLQVARQDPHIANRYPLHSGHPMQYVYLVRAIQSWC